jgi:hypothetical protein
MVMNQNYFQKFPLVSYNYTNARNILARTKLLEVIRKNQIALLPYTIQEGERADTISNFYYGSPFYAWAIYLVNDIIDPQTQWPKTEEDLNSYIEAKYGSLEKARDVILYYRVNWATDSSTITESVYNALPDENQKYWKPNYGFNKAILFYDRKELDWNISTNRIDKLDITVNTSSNSFNFVTGERLYQYSNTDFLSVKGTLISVSNVIINSSSNTTATLHVEKVLFANSNLSHFIYSTDNSLQGRTSNSNVVVTSSERVDNTATIQTKISSGSILSDSELVYWEPVDAETHERELNSLRKEINVLDKNFIGLLEENLQNLLMTNA